MAGFSRRIASEESEVELSRLYVCVCVCETVEALLEYCAELLYSKYRILNRAIFTRVFAQYARAREAICISGLTTCDTDRMGDMRTPMYL